MARKPQRKRVRPRRQPSDSRRAQTVPRQHLPTMSSFSHRRKLARAEIHIQMAEDLISGWHENGYRVFEKPNGERGIDVLAEATRPFPDQLPLIIGDALHCIRSSLDQIVFALSKANTPNMT